MRIRKNGKVVTLTESDLRRIVKRVISEQTQIRDVEIPTLGTFKAHPNNRVQQNPSVALTNDEYGTIHAKYDCKTGKVSLNLTTATTDSTKGGKSKTELVAFFKGFNDNESAAKVKEIKNLVKGSTEKCCGKPEKDEKGKWKTC